MSERQREYAAFLSNMDVRLGAFILADLPESVAQEDGTQARFPKDLSPESLPMIEHFVLSRFSTTAEVVAEENRRFTEGLIRYLGETYLRAVGGAWDHDETTGNGMPFIRPDSAEGPLRGEPIPLVAVILTAVDERTGTIFTAVLDKAKAGLGDSGPQRACTGLAIGLLTAENSTREEVDFLSRFIGTVEPGIAAWTKEQAEPSFWTFDRESLIRLGRQISVRYDSPEEMMAEDEVPFVAGAMRFIGETIRRHGFGQWRYGSDVDADDPRHKQPYIRFTVGEQNLDIVPWKLAQTALDDSESLASALDTIIAMRTEEAEAKERAAEESVAEDR
ncbi:hypothetical protein DFO66_1147 [Brevibacterium sanguinis]|uniref:Uncharacterized protein n=2 Tax=Brevibacterium TaxID=1696 RepID=A0A366IG98_9MICO|nr:MULTISPECIES: hypothetical protein [Brevibacterium]RBP62501.1 hypothetical protein DFO66_1147 [Brevibacterium sanguinis]RBP69165.1 hypothetical protein DFO65_1147 [Brevibacterium celere]